MANKPWYHQELESLDQQQWELLCDRCGRCCVQKLIDDETEELYFTSVACRLFDNEKACCSDYKNRLHIIASCLQISLEQPEVFNWLPSSCAYRLRFEGKPLPEWHPLVSGDNNAMIEAGVCVAGTVISELQVDEENLQDYIVRWK